MGADNTEDAHFVFIREIRVIRGSKSIFLAI
jgi:DNA-binding cell septation regulator SpoVG